jgi:ribulose-bisphosphate carboxylase small chain
MWGLPHFDTKVEDFDNVMREVRAAREAFPEMYIKVIAYDPTYTRQTTAFAFIVNRPSVERPFKFERIQGPGRVNRVHFVQTDSAAHGDTSRGAADFNGGSTSGAPTE